MTTVHIRGECLKKLKFNFCRTKTEVPEQHISPRIKLSTLMVDIIIIRKSVIDDVTKIFNFGDFL